jgi:hypothetical protein
LNERHRKSKRRGDPEKHPHRHISGFLGAQRRRHDKGCCACHLAEALNNKSLSGRNELFIVFVAPLLLGAIYAGYVWEQGNFHPITEGEAYRSAQMDGNELKICIDKYRIKSILNLRGPASAMDQFFENWLPDSTVVRQ